MLRVVLVHVRTGMPAIGGPPEAGGFQTMVESEGGGSTLRRKLTEPEDTGWKVEGANPAAGIGFSLGISIKYLYLFRLTTSVQLHSV